MFSYQQPHVTLSQLDEQLQGLREGRGVVTVRTVSITPDRSFYRRSGDRVPGVIFMCPSHLELSSFEPRRGARKRPFSRREVRRWVENSTTRLEVRTDPLLGLMPPWDSKNVDLIDFELVITPRRSTIRPVQRSKIGELRGPDIVPSPLVRPLWLSGDFSEIERIVRNFDRVMAGIDEAIPSRE